MTRNAAPNLWTVLDEIPVTSLVLAAYLAMAVLTDPFSPTTRSLIEHGAGVGLLIQDGEPWRLLTHAFLHGGLIHLLFNTYALWSLGPALERRLGSARYAILYVVAAVGGGIVGALWHHPLSPLVGGSGALFGMMGAYVAVLMRQGRGQFDFLDNHSGKRLLGVIAINFAFGFLVPVVSNAAHFGGLVSGFVCAWLFLDRGRVGADAITRLAQSGWVAVLLAGILWTMFPVTRWDHQLKMSREAPTAELRAQWETALTRRITIKDISWFRQFTEPEISGERGTELRKRWIGD